MIYFVFCQKTADNHPPKCIGKSMYFWNHTNPEQKALGTSRSNPTEIKKITEVASHLLKCDYSPADITVLCAYRGQVKKSLICFMFLFLCLHYLLLLPLSLIM